MKLISFNCTIEISKDNNGYSNYYYVDVNDKGVSVSHPYINMQPEAAAFITQLIHDFINDSINFNRRIDGFNRDMQLEQYAPKPVLDTETTTESLAESAEMLSSGRPEGSNSIQVLGETEESKVLEETETGSDKA